VIDVNDRVKARMIDKILELCDDDLKGKRIAIFGVTFKPNTDDMREAPSLTIVPALIGRGAEVRVVDPQGQAEGEALLPRVEWMENPYEAAEGADAIVVLTEWNEFRGLNLRRLSKAMRSARMADLRNVYSRRDVLKAGFERYAPVGIARDKSGVAPKP
jgi:UDPglucose 6-dehydrogenase